MVRLKRGTVSKADCEAEKTQIGSKNLINELVYKIERDSQTEKTKLMVTKVGGGIN